MRILRTYILREHVAPFLVTISGLTAVLLVGNIIKFAELVIAKGVSPFDILRLLLYLIPYMLSFTIPMACLIAIILAFGRLSTDFELIAMRASGVAPIRLVFPMLVVGLMISVGLLIVNDRVVPASHLAFRRQLKAIGIKRPAAYIEEGTFIKEFTPYIIFVYQVEGQKLDNVRIYEPQPAGPTRTIIAERGAFEPMPDKRGVQLKLFDGTIDEWDPAHPGSFYKVAFATYTMALHTDQGGGGREHKKLLEMTLKELNRERRLLKKDGVGTMPVSLELHRRVASSFAVVVFILFGLALGLRLHHHERLISYVWILGIFILYYLGSIGMNALALKNWLRPGLAMWVPNFVGAAVSGVMVLKAVRR